ncbi:hypothetical protein EZ428_21280 [Pedobacter frigiditerrae]|uniref:Uncharacterized protein n=1 Tax=Pedobacter frigiditerrae TaxID=2530452 RepID=A0A4R0MKV1_9SPHI|nr:hypothetical protein [Pedobacter frigiditerrae]TCC87241.1 hypothetical protein EZ428_21280 [Pedobacter frigiditerrae]
MGNFLESLGGIVAGAIIATGSALSTGCDVVTSAACQAGKIVSDVAEGVASIAEDKSKNDRLGS